MEDEVMSYNQAMLDMAVNLAAVGSEMLKQAIMLAYEVRGFPGDNPLLLFNGLVEEIGELSELINMDQFNELHLSERKQALLPAIPEHIAAELGDVLTYTAAIANYYEVTPVFTQWSKEREPAA